MEQSPPGPVPEIEPLELKALLDANSSVCLLDVREPEEFELVKLEGAQLVPLMELEERLEEIGSLHNGEYTEWVVYCRSGGRSELAAQLLGSRGMTRFKNLRGGINAYATEADSRLSPY